MRALAYVVAVAVGTALTVGVFALPAEAAAVPVRGTLVAVDDGGRVTFDGDVVLTTASEHQRAQLELQVPVRVGLRGPLRYRFTADGPVVRVQGSYPSSWALRGRQTWTLVDEVDGRRRTVQVVVARPGGR